MLRVYKNEYVLHQLQSLQDIFMLTPNTHHCKTTVKFNTRGTGLIAFKPRSSHKNVHSEKLKGFAAAGNIVWNLLVIFSWACNIVNPPGLICTSDTLLHASQAERLLWVLSKLRSVQM